MQHAEFEIPDQAIAGYSVGQIVSTRNDAEPSVIFAFAKHGAEIFAYLHWATEAAPRADGKSLRWKITELRTPKQTTLEMALW